METLEQAAIKYDLDNFNKPTKGENVLIPEHTAQQWNISAFKAGAEWQKEQYKQLIELIRESQSVLLNEGLDELSEKIDNELERLQD